MELVSSSLYKAEQYLWFGSWDLVAATAVGIQLLDNMSANYYSLPIGGAGNFMIKRTCLFGTFMAVASTIACTLLAAEPDGADSSATDPAVRMKSWEQHVKLRQESIFKDLKWTPVGPRIQGGKIESIWSVKKRKSTIYAGAGSGKQIGRASCRERV